MPPDCDEPRPHRTKTRIQTQRYRIEAVSKAWYDPKGEEGGDEDDEVNEDDDDYDGVYRLQRNENDNCWYIEAQEEEDDSFSNLTDTAHLHHTSGISTGFPKGWLSLIVER